MQLAWELRLFFLRPSTVMLQLCRCSSLPMPQSTRQLAWELRHLVVVELLLAVGALVDQATTDGSTPLYRASINDFVFVVKHLLASGASTTLACGGITSLRAAQHLDHTAVVELLELWPVLSPLVVAIVMRRHATMWELLHSGEDPVVKVHHQQRTLSAPILARPSMKPHAVGLLQCAPKLFD